MVWLDALALILMLPVWQVTLLNCAALARFMHTANNDGLAQVCIAHERKGSDELLATKEDTITNARSNTASKTQEVKCSGNNAQIVKRKLRMRDNLILLWLGAGMLTVRISACFLG